MGRFPWTPTLSNKDANGDRTSPDQAGKSKPEGSKRSPNVNQILALLGEESISPPRTSRSVAQSPSPTSKSSVDQPSRPHSSRESPLPRLPEESSRQENSARSLLTKSSRILKRRNSKRDAGPVRPTIKVIQNGVSSPDDSPQPHSGSSIKSSFGSYGSSSFSKASSNKPTISSPYGFQHVAHTSQTEFQTFNRLSEYEPSNGITAVPQIPTAAVTSKELPQLPITPPRLRQPAHRSAVLPQLETTHIQASRSVENFSRLTRSPVPSSKGFSPVSERSAPRLSGRPESASLESLSNWAEETVGTIADVADLRHRSSGLPQIPEDTSTQPQALVHAVSTSDQSAVRLSVSATSDSPQAMAAAVERKAISTNELESDAEQYGALRHSQSFTSTALLRRRSQSSGDVPLESNFAGITCPSSSTIKSARMSIGLKRIDIDDWEDAIDYAWDHPMDMEEDSGLRMAEKMPWSRPESFLVVREPSYDSSTRSSTPLMMQPPDKPLPIPDPSKRLAKLDGAFAHAPPRGLGIASATPVPQNPETAIAASNKMTRDSFGGPLERPGSSVLGRELPASPISKSSSQESIILSIASSIMGTCRSSNSSNSLGDISELTSALDKASDVVAPSRTPSAAIAIAAPKPTSASTTPDTIEPSDSDDSQETIVSDATSTFPVVAATAIPLRPQSAEERAARPTRSLSISEAFVLSRSSSITGRSAAKGGARSSTLASRPRHLASRASYSLFPPVKPVPAPPSS